MVLNLSIDISGGIGYAVTLGIALYHIIGVDDLEDSSRPHARAEASRTGS